MKYSAELGKALGVSRRMVFKYFKRVKRGEPPRLANKGGRKPLFTEEEKWQLAQTQTSDFEAAVLDVLELKVTCLYLYCCMHTSHHAHTHNHLQAIKRSVAPIIPSRSFISKLKKELCIKELKGSKQCEKREKACKDPRTYLTLDGCIQVNHICC
jgi:hypothetical protein